MAVTFHPTKRWPTCTRWSRLLKSSVTSRDMCCWLCQGIFSDQGVIIWHQPKQCTIFWGKFTQNYLPCIVEFDSPQKNLVIQNKTAIFGQVFMILIQLFTDIRCAEGLKGRLDTFGGHFTWLDFIFRSVHSTSTISTWFLGCTNTSNRSWVKVLYVFVIGCYRCIDVRGPLLHVTCSSHIETHLAGSFSTWLLFYQPRWYRPLVGWCPICFYFFSPFLGGLKDMTSISKSDCQIGLYIVGVSPRDFRRFRDGLWVLFAKHSCTGVCLTFTTFATLRMIWIFYTIRNLYWLLPSPSSPYIMQPKSPGFLEFTLLPLPPLHVWQWHLLQRTLCPQSNSQTCTFLKFEHYLKSSRIQWSFLVPFNWW